MNPQRAEPHRPKNRRDWGDDDSDDNRRIRHPLPDTASTPQPSYVTVSPGSHSSRSTTSSSSTQRLPLPGNRRDERHAAVIHALHGLCSVASIDVVNHCRSACGFKPRQIAHVAIGAGGELGEFPHNRVLVGVISTALVRSNESDA